MRDGLTVDPAPWNPGSKGGARRREFYEDQGARNSILAGARPRDRIRWRRPVRSPRTSRLPTGRAIRFERLDRALILHRVTRARADMREAERLQELADRALVVVDAEALADDPLQVDPTPAHDAMHDPVGPGLDEFCDLGPLSGRQARLRPLRPAIQE